LSDPPPDLESKLVRVIGPLGFAAITLNGLIGGGIFGLPGRAVGLAGDFSPWMFLVCAALFLTIVLSFAVVASHFRQTGGPSVYVSFAFGDFAGFQTGWLLMLGRITAMAANTVLMVEYAAWFWPALEGTAVRLLAVTAVIVALTLVNYAGVRQGLTAVLALTVLKLIPLGVVVGVGLAHLSPGTLFGAPFPAANSVGETLLLLFYAFVGFEGGVVNAGEGRDPQRDIPRALVRTVLATAVLYFMIQWVTISIPRQALGDQRPLVDVAEFMLGGPGAILLTLGAVLSIGGNLSATMISAPRMSYALARDGCLPRWFSALHPRHATPVNSILFVGVLGLGLALSNSFKELAVMSTLARLLGYLLCIASIPRVQRRTPPADCHLRLTGGLVVPALALLICGALVTQAQWPAWRMMSIAMVAGGVLFWVTRRRR
jgi:amino acid transporter